MVYDRIGTAPSIKRCLSSAMSKRDAININVSNTLSTLPCRVPRVCISAVCWILQSSAIYRTFGPCYQTIGMTCLVHREHHPSTDHHHRSRSGEPPHMTMTNGCQTCSEIVNRKLCDSEHWWQSSLIFASAKHQTTAIWWGKWSLFFLRGVYKPPCNQQEICMQLAGCNHTTRYHK